MEELIERRQRTSKTFHRGGRSYRVISTIGLVHEPDGQGGWREITNEWTPEVAPWCRKMVSDAYTVRVKPFLNTGQVLQFTKNGQSVYLQPMALEWTNDLNQIQQISMPSASSPLISTSPFTFLRGTSSGKKGIIDWSDAYGSGVDFKWTTSPSKLAKVLTVDRFNNLPVPEQYITDGGNPVLRLNFIFDPDSSLDIMVDGSKWNKRTKKTTFKAIEFWYQGEKLFQFRPLYYWDTEEGLGHSVATIEKRGNSLYISIRVPYEWLQTATYPVFIDADIDVAVAAEGDDGARYSGTVEFDTDGVGGAYHFVGNPGGAEYGIGDLFARFLGITVPAGSTFDDGCSIWYYPRLAPAGIPELLVYGVDEDSPAAPTSRAEYDADNLTDAVVTWDGAWAKFVDTQSPELKTIFTELLASYTLDNDAVMLQTKDDGSGAGNFNYPCDNSYNPPDLDINYTEAGVGWANIASLRQGTGEVASADIANIRMGTGSIAVADIAKIGGVAV